VLTSPQRGSKHPPAKARLDARLIDRWQDHPARPFTIRDTELRGFAVRIGASGAASYSLTYRDADGRQRTFTLDSPAVRRIDWDKPSDNQRPSDDPADYRFAAEMIKLRMRDDRAGNDPIFRRRNAIDEAAEKRRGQHQFADVCVKWIEARSGDKKSFPSDRSLLTKYIIPALGDFPLAQLGTDAGRAVFVGRVRAQFDAITKQHSYQANRYLSLMSALWNFAGKGIRPKRRSGATIVGLTWLDTSGMHNRENPIGDILPSRNHERARKRWLQPAEFGALAAYLRAHAERQPAMQIWMMAFTGARRGEVLSADWDQFDLAAGYWFRPASIMKADRDAEPLPLAVPLREMLITMHDMTGRPASGAIWQGKDRGLTALKRFWNRLRKETDLPDLRFHDLRRTFGSWAAQSGGPMIAISKAMAHSSVGITETHYSHLGASPVRGIVDTVARMIEDASVPQATPAEK
jgi:integrase